MGARAPVGLWPRPGEAVPAQRPVTRSWLVSGPVGHDAVVGAAGAGDAHISHSSTQPGASSEGVCLADGPGGSMAKRAVLQPSLLPEASAADQRVRAARRDSRGAAVRYASVGTGSRGPCGPRTRAGKRPRTGPLGAIIPTVQAGFSPLTCTLGCLLSVAFATRLSLSALGAVGSECTLSLQVNSPVRRIGILDTRTDKERLEPSRAMPGRLDRRCAQSSPGRRPQGF